MQRRTYTSSSNNVFTSDQSNEKPCVDEGVPDAVTVKKVLEKMSLTKGSWFFVLEQNVPKLFVL